MGKVIKPGRIHTSNIILHTRKRTSINNEQYHDFAPQDSAFIAQMRAEYAGKPNLDIRTNPSTIYNCHGLTFTTKRTWIWQIEELHKILADDDYQEVNKEHVLPGDIVLYFSDTGDDITHSGIVLTTPEKFTGMPKILSKWAKFGEVIHYAHVGPYPASNIKYFRVVK